MTSLFAFKRVRSGSKAWVLKASISGGIRKQILEVLTEATDIRRRNLHIPAVQRGDVDLQNPVVFGCCLSGRVENSLQIIYHLWW